MTGSPEAPRRILLVGRDYFFYTRAIADTLRSHIGAEVDFVAIEPASRLFNLARRLPWLARLWQDRYHQGVIKRLQSNSYQILLFIQVHQLQYRLAWYKEKFPSARSILYYWDSLKTHDYRAYLPFFDQVFTFDPCDAEQQPGLTYLPLFFTPEFRKLRNTQERPYDLSFVGTAVNRTRYDQLTALREESARQDIRLFDYLLVSPFFYLSELLRGRRLRKIRFRSLSRLAVIQAYSSAAAVLDLPNNQQSGFTMRTFETLGAHRKLVTTNPRAATALFQSRETVCVLEPEAALPPRAWLREQAAFPSGIERYSLEAWTETLLGADCPRAPNDEVEP